MSGEDFEARLLVLFRGLGYAAELTPAQGDFGADLILTRDGVRTAVQAKRHTRRIGNAAVQQALAGREHYGCQRAIVVTSSYFTEAARRQAASARVELWDRDRLTEELLTVERQRVRIAENQSAGHSHPPEHDARAEPSRLSKTLLTEPAPPLDDAATAQGSHASAPTVAHPERATECRFCRGSRLAVQYGRYGYYLKCEECGGNTPITETCRACGHKERIRKSGQRFYSECHRCRTSRLFWSNRC
jgi:restriction system protein